MESGNASLKRAAKAKADEFYTQLPDIETELRHYKEHFKGKKILCNCDDPFESNFFKYFAMNFNYLGLARLTATSYVDSPIAEGQLPLFEVQGLGVKQGDSKKPYKIEITEVSDEDSDGATNLADVEYLLRNQGNTLSLLAGDGDFRSQECIDLLKDADIVVTNPPFSLLREYIALLIESGVKFLVIGNQNAVTYKDMFRFLQNNKVWLGYHNGDMEFVVPDYYEPRETRYREENGVKYRSMGNICWFTNLDTIKRHENLILYRKYSPETYPNFDNYSAINVDKVADIPYDYEGPMGVPITFLHKFNSNQFEIINANDIRISDQVPIKPHGLIKDKDGAINGKPTYVRIVIRRKGAPL